MTPDGTPGGTVLLQADNSWRTVAATLAAGMTGGVLALVNRHTTRAEFAAALEDIRPDAVIAEPSRPRRVVRAGQRHAPPAAHRPAEALDGWTVLAGRGPRDVSRWSGGTLIGLTSGSTGRPKGVVQSESALRYACTCTIDVNGLRDGDAVAAVVPLSSTAAYCFGVCLALMLGGPLVLSGRWDREQALARMAAHDVRWTMCVPTMALQMGSAAAGSRVLDGVRSITVGGGPMDRGALAGAERSLGTRILRVFGMSECLAHLAVARRPRGRSGWAATAARSPAPNCAPWTPTAPPWGWLDSGRAQVQGPSLFLGYAHDGKVESPVLTPGLGFFPTGDLLMTGDDGTVTVMGREKDVIIRGGRNLDVTEIERAVASHPGVARVCVAPVPDPLLGERAAVLVVAEAEGEAGRTERETASEAAPASDWTRSPNTSSAPACPRPSGPNSPSSSASCRRPPSASSTGPQPADSPTNCTRGSTRIRNHTDSRIANHIGKRIRNGTDDRIRNSTDNRITNSTGKEMHDHPHGSHRPLRPRPLGGRRSRDRTSWRPPHPASAAGRRAAGRQRVRAGRADGGAGPDRRGMA